MSDPSWGWLGIVVVVIATVAAFASAVAAHPARVDHGLCHSPPWWVSASSGSEPAAHRRSSAPSSSCRSSGSPRRRAAATSPSPRLGACFVLQLPYLLGRGIVDRRSRAARLLLADHLPHLRGHPQRSRASCPAADRVTQLPRGAARDAPRRGGARRRVTSRRARPGCVSPSSSTAASGRPSSRSPSSPPTCTGLIVAWNPGAERMLGPHESTRPWASATSSTSSMPASWSSAPRSSTPASIPSTTTTVSSTWSSAAREGYGDNARVDLRARRRHADPRATVGSPRIDETGQVVGFIFIGTDLTQAREVNKLKDEFVGMISHELRTPLSSILGYLELIRDEDRGAAHAGAARLPRPSPSATRTVCSRSSATCCSRRRWRRASSRSSARPSNSARSSPRPSSRARPAAERNGVEPRAPSCRGTAVVVDGDPMRLAQACDNLISNALKFTPRGGTVTVSLTRDRDRGRHHRPGHRDGHPGRRDRQALHPVLPRVDGDATGRAGRGARAQHHEGHRHGAPRAHGRLERRERGNDIHHRAAPHHSGSSARVEVGAIPDERGDDNMSEHQTSDGTTRAGAMSSPSTARSPATPNSGCSPGADRRHPHPDPARLQGPGRRDAPHRVAARRRPRARRTGRTEVPVPRGVPRDPPRLRRHHRSRLTDAAPRRDAAAGAATSASPWRSSRPPTTPAPTSPR